MTASYECLDLEIDHAVAKVTLNRPQVRNAFNAELIAELTHVFQHLAASSETRVVVLAAHGVGFCAGADLAWMKAMAAYTYEENLADAHELACMLQTIYDCPHPVVAKVQGDAYGGGVGLVAVSDVVVASEKAHFCLSEARLGLLPATISPYVIKALGVQASRRYFVTAERFGADQAHRLGLVHECVKEAQLDASVDQIVSGILQNGPQAIKACKQLVKDFADRDIDKDLVDDSVRRIAQIRCTPEAQARMKSFLEKK